ncbi:hypothetical protein [Celerinatantimonas sp. MCCC 1A17872]|uniref:hypothetical protein n=1 Tax=Celerinatantimonas sp. MCCC 1A17872 TaxID=3177514 RepID=UPI0038C2DC7B
MPKRKPLKGHIVQSDDSHIRYEISNETMSFFTVLQEIMCREFGALITEEPSYFISEVIGEFKLKSTKFYWGWDDNSGVYILSLCKNGDSLIKELAIKLNEYLRPINYGEYING